MAPEPSVRTHHHRRQPRSPSRERSRRHDGNRNKSDRSNQDSPSCRRKDPRTARTSRAKSSSKTPRVRFSMMEAESSARIITTKATRSGFLRKQADNEPGAWNEYYFAIKPLTYLFYYNSKDDEKPRGIIDLEYLTDVKRNADCLQRAVGGGDNCFRISGKLPRPTSEQLVSGDIPKMRPLYLDTDDEDEAEKWMEAIRNHRFSVKKDEQFYEMVQRLREAELRVEELEEAQQRDADINRALRVKAKTLLQKMRAADSGSTDELPEVNVDDLDDVADDMLAMLEGIEDVLVNLQLKLGKIDSAVTKGDKVGVTSSRRGFTLLSRATNRRENASILEVPEEEEEEALAAIRSRRNCKPQPPAEKLKENLVEKPRDKTEEVEAADNVSNMLGLWKAKKKIFSPVEQASLIKDDDGNDSRNKLIPRSTGKDMAPQSAVKFSLGQKGRRFSEEDTASIDSSEDRDSDKKSLLPGWTKHESNRYPGTFYYAHESGKVSWDPPTEDMMDGNHGNNNNVNNYADDGHGNQDEVDDFDVYNEYDNNSGVIPDKSFKITSSPDCLSENDTDAGTAGGTSSAAYRKIKKPKPKSTWAFKLPKLLPTTTSQTAPTEVAVSSHRGFNHHEF